MKAVINLDVTEWQIGQKVSIYFPDNTVKYAVCEAVKVKPRREKLLPCKCGGIRRSHWFGMNPESAYSLECKKCGFMISGKSEADAYRKWNEAVKVEEAAGNYADNPVLQSAT